MVLPYPEFKQNYNYCGLSGTTSKIDFSTITIIASIWFSNNDRSIQHRSILDLTLLSPAYLRLLHLLLTSNDEQLRIRLLNEAFIMLNWNKSEEPKTVRMSNTDLFWTSGFNAVAGRFVLDTSVSAIKMTANGLYNGGSALVGLFTGASNEAEVKTTDIQEKQATEEKTDTAPETVRMSNTDMYFCAGLGAVVGRLATETTVDAVKMTTNGVCKLGTAVVNKVINTTNTEPESKTLHLSSDSESDSEEEKDTTLRFSATATKKRKAETIENDIEASSEKKVEHKQKRFKK